MVPRTPGAADFGASRGASAIIKTPQEQHGNTSDSANTLKERASSKHRTSTDPSKVWACDRCYRLKYKCDSLRPACTRCVGGGFECKYGSREVRSATARESTGPIKRKTARRYDTAGYIRMLETRMRDMENTFASIDGGILDSAPAMTHIGSSASSAQFTYTGLLANDPMPPIPLPHSSPTLLSATPILSPGLPPSPYIPQQLAINTPIYQPYAFDAYQVLQAVSNPGIFPTNTSSSTGALPISVTIENLFTPEVIKDILRTFFDDVAYRWLQSPIHEALFMARFDKQPQFLVYTMCAIAASASSNPVLRIYLQERGLPGYKAGDPYFQRSLGMLKDVGENPSVDNVIGIGTLKVACTMIDEGRWSSTLRAMAIDMATKLKLHIDPDVEEVHQQLTWLEKEKRRRTWWCLFVMDTLDCNPEDRKSIIPHHIVPGWDPTSMDQSWAVKPTAPEAVFNSITNEHDEPNPNAFIPGVHYDVAEFSHRLTGLYMRVQRLRGTIWTLVDKANGRGPTSHIGDGSESWMFGSDVQAQLDDLDGKLQACLQVLPAWAQQIDHYETFTASTASTYPPPWQLYSQHLIWHCLNIALHIPTLFIEEQLEQSMSPGSPEPPHRVTSAYVTCFFHSRRVSTLLHKLRAMNPEARYMTQWTCYLAFYSVLVLVMVLKTSRDEREVQDMRRDIEVHLWLMGALGERYHLAKSMYGITKAVMGGDEGGGYGDGIQEYPLGRDR